MQNYTRIFQALAEATTELLTTRDLDTAIERALAVVGAASDVDCAHLFEQQPTPGTAALRFRLRGSWSRFQTEKSDEDAEAQSIVCDPTTTVWCRRLSTGAQVRLVTGAFPRKNRTIFEALGISNLLASPIRVYEQFWGFVTISTRDVKAEWNPILSSTLNILAGGLSGALALHQSQLE